MRLPDPVPLLDRIDVNHYDRVAYDPETGVFTWAVSGRGIAIGKVAGFVQVDGYRTIKVGRKPTRGGRLAWFLVHGEWPDGEIDHINGNRSDDRIANLRVVDRSGNSQNRHGLQANNRSGFRGVCWVPHAGRWRACIMANKVMHRLGYFTTPEAASAAYERARSSLHINGGGH